MKTPEDDEFDRIQREQAMGWRKRQIVNEMEKNMNNEPVAWINLDRFKNEALYLADCVSENEVENMGITTPLYTHPVKEQDSVRYQWLRNEFALGRETYLAEGMPSGESLDKYIDEQLRKSQEK